VPDQPEPAAGTCAFAPAGNSSVSPTMMQSQLGHWLLTMESS